MKRLTNRKLHSVWFKNKCFSFSDLILRKVFASQAPVYKCLKEIFLVYSSFQKLRKDLGVCFQVFTRINLTGVFINFRWLWVWKNIIIKQFQMGDESACSSFTMSSVGSIQLSVCHDVNLNLLTVSIIKAVDLPTKREDDLPNPFMKVSLEVITFLLCGSISIQLRFLTRKNLTLTIKPKYTMEQRLP